MSEKHLSIVPRLPVKYTPRPERFQMLHSTQEAREDICACEVCWTERSVALERKMATADQKMALDESRLVASREEDERNRDWRAQQLSHFRTWTMGMATILRLPAIAWAAVELVRIILAGP